jgi:hypothetical protein
MTDADEFIHLTSQLHSTLNEFDNRFKEFLYELMKAVPSMVVVTP